MDLDYLWDITPARLAALPRETELSGSIDTHVHLRNNARSGDGRMEMAVAECAAEHEAVVAIGNTNPEVTSAADSLLYLKQARACIPKGNGLQILMAPLVGDHTDPEMVRQAWDRPDGQEDFHALKIFFDKVSNAKTCVTDINRIAPLIQSVTRGLRHKKRPIPITFHAEVFADKFGEQLPIAEREWYCVQHVISAAIAMNPDATYVLRHISDGRTIEWAQEQRRRGVNVHLEICPQYSIMTEEDLFIADDGRAALQCNCICWPRFKNEWSRVAVENIALSGLSWVHEGTDYALHLDDPTLSARARCLSSFWHNAVRDEHILKFVALNCLYFDQPLRDSVEEFAMFVDDLLCLVVCIVDNLFYFSINFTRDFFRIRMVLYPAAKECAAALALERHGAHFSLMP
jgi:dihydroorotase